MDFKYTEDQRMFKETARSFAEGEIAPLIEEMEESKRTPPQLIEKMKELNFYGIQYPEEYGGCGATYLEYAMVMEELARVYCSIPGHISVNCLCAGTIYEFGTKEQKKKYLPGLLQGESIGSFAFTEASTGSNPKDLKTTAIREGDEWLINGEKLFITNSTFPGVMALFCRDVEVANKTTCIIVPKDTPGYSTSKLVRKLGMHGMEVADVVLQDVRVPYENTVGGEAYRGRGFEMLTRSVSVGKLGISAHCVGMSQAALEEASKYAKERLHGGKPIARFGTVQWIIGEMSAELEAARYLTYATAYEKSQGGDIFYSSPRARLVASQVCHRAVSNAMQVMGAYAYTEEYNLARIFRDMKLTEIYEGVNEIQRVIAASEHLR